MTAPADRVPDSSDERFEARIAEIDELLAAVLDEVGRGGRRQRHLDAQRLGEAAASALAVGQAQLVYGELDVRSVARILDAVEVRRGDRFLDIGSGDGLPTLAAALLHPDAFAVCRGIEIVPALVARAEAHARGLRMWLAERGRGRACPIELLEGDIHDGSDPAISRMLGDTNLALCFATTWSHEPRRVLPRLSATLSAGMAEGARVVLVDARLLESDGWRWEGDLTISTPDTAPHSTARLYTLIRARRR